MADTTLRPSSLINTIYGAYLRRLGGWISVADLIVLMGELGVEAQAVRSAISRLKKRGIVEPERRCATGYRLNPAVEAVFAEGDVRIFGSLEPSNLTDGWVIAVFSVPETERAQRYQLRTRLSWLGFGNMAPGVWLAPARLLDVARSTLARVGLSEYVHLFVSHYVAFSDLRVSSSSWWDFPAIQKQYAEFTDTYHPLLERLSHEAPTDDTEAFRYHVPMLTKWRRLPYLDPGLPTELLPDDWNAVTARRTFQQLHGIFAEPSLRHVRRLTGLAITPAGASGRP
ncbi:PaaX family transcriptional regulator C-terminal domain-containing protein [Streptomyces sp. NPDC005474]|uniref:PaaX family transcriptional regulator n=1 Tax=Streptomyces sp. NPDC005474 TaxID=3154878 RepID=UPI003456A6E4